MARSRTLLVAAALSIASCSTDPRTASVEAATTERLPTTTTTVPSTTVPATTTTTGVPPVAVSLLPPARLDRNQPGGPERSWNGERFDFGIIAGVRQVDDAWVVDIDREQIPLAGGGYASGEGIDIEPVLVGDPPRPIRNDSTHLRTFTVRADAEVLRLGADWTCGNDDPRWTSATVQELAVWGVGRDRQDALTFDDAGEVTRIRLSRRC